MKGAGEAYMTGEGGAAIYTGADMLCYILVLSQKRNKGQAEN